MERLSIQVVLSQSEEEPSFEEDMSGGGPPRVTKSIQFVEQGDKIAQKIGPILAEIAAFVGVRAN